MAEPAAGAPVERAAALAALEAAIGHVFADGALLGRALTHRSYLNETDEPDARDNERLEFLGDAVLGFLVGLRVFRALPEADEGRLTTLRAAIVREDTLARFARALALGPLLRMGRGEDATGGRTRPSVLCDAFEALVGALYLDGGLEAAARLVEQQVAPELARVQYARRHEDARGRFQELVQALLQETPRYETVAAEGPDHAKRFTVAVRAAGRTWGVGAGASKAEAARQAAVAALELAREEGLGADAADEPGASTAR